MNTEHDPIVCESKRAELVDMLEKAVGAANNWRAEAERLEIRVHELEATRDQFQARRDQAIREADGKTVALKQFMDGHPIKAEVLKVGPKPGDLVVIQLAHQPKNEDVQGIGRMIQYLRPLFPGVNFLAVGPGHFAFEQFSETDLRARGLISARRVDAGVQQLEALCGAQQEALKRARAMLFEARAYGMGPILDAESLPLIKQLDAILQAELVPDKGPTREQLVALLDEARTEIGTDEQGPSRYERELLERIDAALKGEEGKPS